MRQWEKNKVFLFSLLKKQVSVEEEKRKRREKIFDSSFFLILWRVYRPTIRSRNVHRDNRQECHYRSYYVSVWRKRKWKWVVALKLENNNERLCFFLFFFFIVFYGSCYSMSIWGTNVGDNKLVHSIFFLLLKNVNKA